jgi:bleomycin hydrolase
MKENKNMIISKLFVILLILLQITPFPFQTNAQIYPDFTIVKQIATTPVKNQSQTGTCWCFATISYVETEALRMKKPEFDLSEMFIVRHTYEKKATDYIRYHGNANFSEGGQAHDVLQVIKDYGLIPENDYTGLHYGTTNHVHSEMLDMLKGMLDGTLKNSQKQLTPQWPEAVKAVIDVYLGKVPENFSFENKTYTPQSFAKEVVGFNPDDYIEFTSFSHHPYHTWFDLEIPDNWMHEDYYNVTIDELLGIINNALNNGYSVCWDGDVSESGFSNNRGVALLPYEKGDGEKITDMAKARQQTFDNWQTTDDHLMHITGIAKDKDGNIFYQTKNSWGEDSNRYGGYVYMSEAFVQLKTIAILVHKDVVTKEIKKIIEFK